MQSGRARCLVRGLALAALLTGHEQGYFWKAGEQSLRETNDSPGRNPDQTRGPWMMR